MISEEQPIFWRDKWRSAQRMKKNNPDTFVAPTIENLSEISVGDSIKICNGYERFWVSIVLIEKERRQRATAWKFFGKVDNHLVTELEYTYGDYVVFNGRHIYEIHLKEDFPKIIEKLKKEAPQIVEKISEGDFESVNQMLLYHADKHIN